MGGIGFDGDRGASGVSLLLNSSTVVDALNPANNFFNSTISNRGVPFTNKSPDYQNQLGFDADLVTADGILPNDATSAVIRASSSAVPGSDGFYPQAFTVVTDLYAPAVELAKTVENVTTPGGPAEPGDTLRYTVTLANTGDDGATGVAVRDAIPTGTSYVPGSLALLTGPGAPASPTDAPGDDVAELDGANNRVVFRLGAGANATAGGLIAAAGSPRRHGQLPLRRPTSTTRS